MSRSICSEGTPPASLSFVAFTNTMTFMIALLARAGVTFGSVTSRALFDRYDGVVRPRQHCCSRGQRLRRRALHANARKLSDVDGSWLVSEICEGAIVALAHMPLGNVSGRGSRCASPTRAAASSSGVTARVSSNQMYVSNC